jgi:type IV secretory pathway component VirB8
MTDVKHIEIKRYPKMVGEFAKENFNLKVLSAALIMIVIVVLAMLLYLVKSGPKVIALAENGQIAKVETKITDLQIDSAIREYLSYRYNWSEQTNATQLQKAQFFVIPSMSSAFQKAMLEVQKFVKEKKVTQRVYPKNIQIDLKEKKATILADRITEFDNLKAATELKLVLDFSVDDRSVVNPWGIFITKETEGVSQ